jgi:medium-chain acyl-[acyl-carrier-protein] hydrolase
LQTNVPTTAPDVRFVCKRPVKDAALRLFCFPYAGGGVSIYRQWPEQLPRNVEVQVLEMPGREMRLHEPGFVHVDSLVPVAAAAMRRYLHQPFAFFGHSMGGLIGFELARLLRREHSVEPRALFASGRPAPQLPVEPPTYNLPEKELIEDLREKNGTPEEVLAHAELLQLLIPTLRADFQLCQTYQYKSEPPLKCRIAAFGGLSDPFVSREDLEKWREQTTGPFQVRMFPGDHFFLHSSQSLLLQMLSTDLVQLISTSAK